MTSVSTGSGANTNVPQLINGNTAQSGPTASPPSSQVSDTMHVHAGSGPPRQDQNGLHRVSNFFARLESFFTGVGKFICNPFASCLGEAGEKESISRKAKDAPDAFFHGGKGIRQLGKRETVAPLAQKEVDEARYGSRAIQSLHAGHDRRLSDRVDALLDMAHPWSREIPKSRESIELDDFLEPLPSRDGVYGAVTLHPYPPDYLSDDMI